MALDVYIKGNAAFLTGTTGIGALGRIRTCDLSLRRRSLYPLSYEGNVVSTSLGVLQSASFKEDLDQVISISFWHKYIIYNQNIDTGISGYTVGCCCILR